VGHRSAGHGARPLESEGARSDGYWRIARPAAHASGSEAVATLATAGRQDRAAGAGAHPQAEAVGLVPTAVVRLERTLAHGIHSTRGAGLKGPITGWPGGPVWSTSTAHQRRCGLSWTCGTGRRRFRPANGTRWPFTGSIRRAPPSGPSECSVTSCRDRRRRQLRSPPRPPGDQCACSGPTRRSLWVLGSLACGQLLIRRGASC
jgi:hypothetical protein